MSPGTATFDHGFEQQLSMLEARASRGAEAIIKQHFDRLPLPRRDENNVLRLGFHRDIERRETPEHVAIQHLRHDVQRARQILHGRVFALQARTDISVTRLSVIYALADLLGPDHVAQWSPLWQAMEAGAWPTVMQELLRCNWDGLVGSTDAKKGLFAQLITALISDSMPAAAT